MCAIIVRYDMYLLNLLTPRGFSNQFTTLMEYFMLILTIYSCNHQKDPITISSNYRFQCRSDDSTRFNMANRYILSEASMTLKLKIGNKGYVIIPKAIMEAAGVKEGDELIISLNDGITLTPAKKFNRESFEKAAELHKKEIFELKEALSPQPREVSGFSLEDEFD